MVDPGITMPKIIVDLGGLKPFYMGPSESYHKVAPRKSEPNGSAHNIAPPLPYVRSPLTYLPPGVS